MNLIRIAGRIVAASAIVIAFVLASLTVARFTLRARWMQWLRAERGTYCASLFCMDHPGYTVVSAQRTLTQRMCWRHAVYARAQMVLDGDYGTEVLDTMLERHAERELADSARRRRLADVPDPRELPTWRRGSQHG